MANFAYRVFSEVAKQKTFVSAANVLNVTPSAISHSISGLEEELGFALFVRNRTGIMLTPDGEKVLPIVQEILNSEAKLNEEAARIKGLNQGSIRIGAFSSVCINWLPDVINAFKKKYPEVEREYNRLKKINEEQTYYFQIIRNGSLRKYIFLENICLQMKERNIKD